MLQIVGPSPAKKVKRGRNPALPVAYEHAEQVAFVAWFRLQYPRVLIASVPNGAHLAGSDGQKAAQMARLKAEGLCKGFPDLIVPRWNLAIEMKRSVGGRLDPNQTLVIADLRRDGWTVIVAEGWDDARAQLIDWAGAND